MEILTKKIAAGVSLDGGVKSPDRPPFHEKFWVAAVRSTMEAWALPFPHSRRIRLSLWSAPVLAEMQV